MFDVLIIGGGFAGLSAALLLGRARRSVRVLDIGQPRNRFADAAHGVLALDGVPPSEILDRARSQLSAYGTVELVRATATGADGKIDAFVVTDTSGKRHEARRLIIASGISDIIPDVPGMTACWGTSLIHCPYCHGFEYADKRLGVLYSPAGVADAVTLIGDWSANLTYFANGNPITAEDKSLLASKNIELVAEPLSELVHTSGQLVEVVTEKTRRPLDALFIHPAQKWNNTLPEQLGCEVATMPFGVQVEVDEMKQTTVPGVFAAGDLAKGFQSVVPAMHAGMVAGVAAHRSLLF